MAFGFKLVAPLGQSENVGGIAGEYTINASNTTAMYVGDPVKLVNGELALADPGDAVVGVFAGCTYVDADGSKRFKQYWDGAAGRSNITARVTGTDGKFLVEMDAAQGNAAVTMIGTRRNHVNNAGTPATGTSGAVLGAASASGTFFVEGFPDYPNNTLGQASQQFLVSIAAPSRAA